VSAKETKTENAPEKVPAKDVNSVAANGAEVGPGKGMSPRDEDAPKEALGSSVDPAKKPKSDKADGPKASGTGPSEGSSGTTPRAASTRKGTSKVSARDFSKLMKTGLDHLEGGRPRQAQTVFEQAVRANPSSPRPVANLGWCALDLGQARQAVGLFKRALKLDASHRDAFFGLGKAQEKAGMKVEAAQTYREYLEKYPEDRRARMVRFRLETLSGK
jgi:tetratricopeptide (TPR) repeat protein